ncbi:MAG: hypothetical protein ACRC7R_00085, partial [Sarcina sp.]
KTVKNINKASNNDEEHKYTLQQLSYSIEEMREADSILNNKDLTNIENYNRMITFASSSLDRIRSLKEENITEEMNTHIDFISSIGEEVRQAADNSNELRKAINNLEKTFSSKNSSKEEKENALYNLNDIIVKNVKGNNLNHVTLAKASNILHQYANVTSNKEIEVAPKESEYNLEQMNYAIEEMKEACRLLDSADLSKLSNYERMIRFGTASLDRARSLKLNKNSELACHLEWIEQSGNSIRNTTYALNNLITTIRSEKETFAPYSNATIEEKQNVLSKLEDLIKKEESSNHLNKTTIENVKKIIANCHHSLKEVNSKNTTTSTDSHNKVEVTNKENKKEAVAKTTTSTETATDTEDDNILDGFITTGTETNISTGVNTSTEANLSNGVDASTQTDINNTATTGTETELNNDKTTSPEVDMAVGTDSITETHINNSVSTAIKNDLFEEGIGNAINSFSDVENKKDIAIGDDTILDSTDVKTIKNQDETNVATDIKNPIKTSVATDIKTPIKVSIGKESVSSIKPMISTKINKAPVSAVATQTDIPRVSSVATQTDIPRVSAVATQTDIAPVSSVATETASNTEKNENKITVSKKDEANKTNKENIKTNQEEINKDTTAQTKKTTKSNNNNPFGWLGLGLISTLICATLKKFI